MCCVDRGQVTVSFTVLPPRRTRNLLVIPPNACRAQKTPEDQLVLHCRQGRLYCWNASATGRHDLRRAFLAYRPSACAEDLSSWSAIRVVAGTRTEPQAVSYAGQLRRTWPTTHAGRAVGNRS